VTAPDLAGFYDDSYRRAGDQHARWRALSARGKADHVVELCGRAGLRPGRVLEIGCGDGALLAELRSRGFAGGGDLRGLEVSEEAARLARDRGLEVDVFDGERLPAGDGSFDLAVLSHVLEHVPDPVPLLREAARVAGTVIVEVPLEANLSGRRASKRAGSAEIGHLQALDRSAVRAMVQHARLDPRHELLDPLPREVHTFFAESRPARVAAGVKASVRRGLFAASPRLAERAFTLHYAVLCDKT
jgi:SAM-dependent methyltransferase